MEPLLLKYGYVLLFVGVILEGEGFLLAGSFLAHQGYFRLGAVAGVALAANTLGSQFYYMAARMRGRRWFENRFAGSAHYQRILGWVRRHGSWLVVLSRFAFGFRIVIPAACGAFGMSMVRFLALNVAAGLLWVIPTALLGFYFGGSVESILRQAYEYGGAIVLAVVLTIAVFLSVRHVRRVRSVFQDLQWSDLHGVVPFVMGFMGILNIVTAIWPGSDAALEEIQRWLPFEATQESRTVMLFAGVALLQVTRNLALRKELAWWVAVSALSISLWLHILPRVDMEHSIVSALLLAYLVSFRRRFYTRSDPASMRKGLLIMPLLELMVFLYGAAGLYATSGQFTWPPGTTPATESFRSGILILSPGIIPNTRYAARFLGSLEIAGWISRVYILVMLLRPVILRSRLEAPREAVSRLFRQYGDHSLAALAVQPDKHHLLLLGGRGMIAYASKSSVALSCGDPMAPASLFSAAVKEYADHCLKHGWKPCIYLACEERLAVYHSLGFNSHKAAEEAVIDLRTYRGLSELRVQRYDRARAADPLIDEQLEEVSEDWLQVHHTGEMGFTTGRFSLQSVGDGPAFILGDRHRVEAFCAWLPYKNGGAMVLDLIRQRRTAPPGTMETLLAQALTMLQQDGVSEASVSAVALGRGQLAGFSPGWQNRYLIYPKGANLDRILRTVAAIQKR